jgi:hypothetical protein
MKENIYIVFFFFDEGGRDYSLATFNMLIKCYKYIMNIYIYMYIN